MQRKHILEDLVLPFLSIGNHPDNLPPPYDSAMRLSLCPCDIPYTLLSLHLLSCAYCFIYLFPTV